MSVDALMTGDRNVGDTVMIYISGVRHLGHIKSVLPVDKVVKEVTIQVEEA